MKICLINPKYEAGQRAHRVPLGLSYIAAVLKQNGYEVEGYNLDVDPEPDYSKYDIIGVYVSTPAIKEVRELITRIKKAKLGDINWELVLGGPHLSANQDLAKEFMAIGIEGEGEMPFLQIVKTFEKGSHVFSHIPGVFYEDINGFKYTPKAGPCNLNELPIPARELFDHGNYKDRSFAFGAIVASRGCPFKCKNCQPGLNMISPYRNRKPELVVDEMHTLYTNYAVKDFSFEDSELIISKPWTLRLCDSIINKFNGINITFQCNARLHQLDEEVLAKLKEAGCRRLGIGVESGSQRVIDECLNKQIKLEADLPNLSKIKEHGIESQVWIMIGIPGETEEEVRQTIDMAKNLDVTTIEINIATPWPGTYFYSESKEKGWLIESEEMDEKRKCFFSTPYLKPERVQELFEEFKKELESSGWIKWSHETNCFAKGISAGNIINAAVNKIKRGDVHWSDFGILKDWITK